MPCAVPAGFLAYEQNFCTLIHFCLFHHFLLPSRARVAELKNKELQKWIVQIPEDPAQVS